MMMNSLKKEYLSDLEILEERFNKIGFKKVHKEDFHELSQPGVYALIIYLNDYTQIKRWKLKKGTYIYIGSAKKGLKTRLKRHIKKNKKKFWHIDYLLEVGEVLFAYIGNNMNEKDLAKYVGKYYTPVKGFGNSDDPSNPSHLFYVYPLSHIVSVLYEEGTKRKAPVYKAIEQTKDPFERFIFIFLSSRTKDETTIKITKKFVKKFPSWEKIRSCSLKEMEKILKGVAFHKIKAKNLKEISFRLSKRKIPSTYKELISLPGIGIKIAKVILADIFKKPVIGVDTHVHRISNRIGIINTKKEEETDRILNVLVPQKLRYKFNVAFVGYGQTVCKPINPICGECKIREFCDFYINGAL